MLYTYYLLTSLSDALIGGEENFLENMVTERLHEVGKVWLKEKVADLLGHDFARRAKRGYTTGGLSEVRRLRNRWLGGTVMSARSGFVGRTLRGFSSGFESEFNRRETEVAGSDVRRAVVDRIEHALLGDKHEAADTDQQGTKRSWTRSREQWLDAEWRHDWRSQPRDPHGRWSPGRLKHPYMTKGARRIRRQRIAAARKAVHEAFMRSEQ